MTVLPVRCRMLLEQRVQAAVVERARQHADWLEPERVNHRLQLPEPEVAGDEQHALALRVGEPGALFAFELDAREHRLVATAC